MENQISDNKKQSKDISDEKNIQQLSFQKILTNENFITYMNQYDISKIDLLQLEELQQIFKELVEYDIILEKYFNIVIRQMRQEGVYDVDKRIKQIKDIYLSGNLKQKFLERYQIKLDVEEKQKGKKQKKKFIEAKYFQDLESQFLKKEDGTQLFYVFDIFEKQKTRCIAKYFSLESEQQKKDFENSVQIDQLIQEDDLLNKNLIQIKDQFAQNKSSKGQVLIFDEAISDLSIFCQQDCIDKDQFYLPELILSFQDILYLIKIILETFQALFEKGIVYENLKPQHLVLFRYISQEQNEVTIYKPCYQTKLIDLTSLTYLKDIDENEIKIKKNEEYPRFYQNSFSKLKQSQKIISNQENGYKNFIREVVKNQMYLIKGLVEQIANKTVHNQQMNSNKVLNQQEQEFLKQLFDENKYEENHFEDFKYFQKDVENKIKQLNLQTDFIQLQTNYLENILPKRKISQDKKENLEQNLRNLRTNQFQSILQSIDKDILIPHDKETPKKVDYFFSLDEKMVYFFYEFFVIFQLESKFSKDQVQINKYQNIYKFLEIYSQDVGIQQIFHIKIKEFYPQANYAGLNRILMLQKEYISKEIYYINQDEENQIIRELIEDVQDQLKKVQSNQNYQFSLDKVIYKQNQDKLPEDTFILFKKLTQLNNLSMLDKECQSLKLNLNIQNFMIEACLYGQKYFRLFKTMGKLCQEFDKIGDQKNINTLLSLYDKKPQQIRNQNDFKFINYIGSQENKALNLKELRKFKEAINCIEEVLKAKQFQFEEYLFILQDLAFCYIETCQYAKAQYYLEKALAELQKQSNYEMNINYIKILQDQSFIYSILGQKDQAKKLGLIALQISRKNYGQNNWRYKTVLYKQQKIFRDLGLYKEALQFINEVLEFNEKVHENVYREKYLIELAISQNICGNYEEAKKNYLNAIKLLESQQNIYQHDLGKCFNNLSNNFIDLGDYEEAKKYNKKSFEIQSKVYQVDHIEILKVKEVESRILKCCGQYEESFKGYQNILEIKKKNIGENQIQIANTLNDLSLVQRDLGKIDQALTYCKQSHKIKQNIYGDNHIEFAKSLENLCNLQLDLNNFEEAIQGLQKVIQIKKSFYNENHIEYAKTLLYLSNAQLAKGEINQAEEGFKISKEIFQNFYGSDKEYLKINELFSKTKKSNENFNNNQNLFMK